MNNPYKPLKLWLAPVLGAAIGILYGIFDRFVLDAPHIDKPVLVETVHELFDVMLPILLGIVIGLGFNLIMRQRRFNAYLSTRNSQLQRHFYTNALMSHILHEIRNPVHNLSAVLEDAGKNLPQEQLNILQRNLKNLKDTSSHWARWSAIQEDINPKEPVPIKPWLVNFIDDKIRPQLKDSNIRFEQRLSAAKVNLHPFLLEQILITIFDNALEALGKSREPRSLQFTCALSNSQDSLVELRLKNSGSVFPDYVIEAQGKNPVNSRQGLGLGLMLVRKILKPFGGNIQLVNYGNSAEVILLIPGEKA